MTESSPYPPGFGAPPPGSGPPHGPIGPGAAPQPPPGVDPNTGHARHRTGLLASGVVLAVLLAVAALVLAIVTAVRGPEPSPPTPVPQAEQQLLFVDDADKALCEVIGPLMREQRRQNSRFYAHWRRRVAGAIGGDPTVQSRYARLGQTDPTAVESTCGSAALLDSHTAAVHRWHVAVWRKYVPRARSGFLR